MNENYNRSANYLVAYMAYGILVSAIYFVLNILSRQGLLSTSTLGGGKMNIYDLIFIFTNLISLGLIVWIIVGIKGQGYKIIFGMFLLIELVFFAYNLYTRLVEY